MVLKNFKLHISLLFIALGMLLNINLHRSFDSCSHDDKNEYCIICMVSLSEDKMLTGIIPFPTSFIFSNHQSFEYKHEQFQSKKILFVKKVYKSDFLSIPPPKLI